MVWNIAHTRLPIHWFWALKWVTIGRQSTPSILAMECSLVHSEGNKRVPVVISALLTDHIGPPRNETFAAQKLSWTRRFHPVWSGFSDGRMVRYSSHKGWSRKARGAILLNVVFLRCWSFFVMFCCHLIFLGCPFKFLLVHGQPVK